MKESKDKILEYETASSGFVILGRYKEPLMKYEKGYGYQGALVFDGKSGDVQCHICGKWFHSLQAHIRYEHKLTARLYRSETGLARRTALISESLRNKLIEMKIGEKRVKSFSFKGRKHSIATRKKIAEALRVSSMEYKNIRGTCPEQILDRLQKMTQKFGRTPTEKEMGGLYNTTKKVYGSIETACRLAGIQYRVPGTNKDFGRNSRKYSNEFLIQMIKEFRAINSREPSYSDIRRKFIPSYELYWQRFGGLRKAIKISHSNP